MSDDALEKLQKEIRVCHDCVERFGYFPHPIAFGKKEAKIMQISQAPSKLVHETLRPFNDPSGKRLREQWYRISDDVFYDPTCFYITSIAHCYPGKAKNGGDQKPPKYCADKWLEKEMACVENEIYILIGRYAAHYFFPKENFTQMIFEDHWLNGKPTFILPHPSPLNMRWFKMYPQFEAERMPKIAEKIKEILELPLE